LIRGIKENVPNVDKAIISVHGHNDLAVANFLEAARMALGSWNAPSTALANGLETPAGKE